MKGNSSNGQLTAQINLGDHKKSGFDLSNNVLGTGKLGRIYPTRALHVMPNDTIKNDTKVAVQFEPLAVPILANMYVKQEHFYAPYNIVWKNWDNFISGGEKLDYNGTVPNTTMKSMIGVVCSKIFEDVFLPIKTIKNTSVFDANGYYLTTESDMYDTLNGWLDVIKVTGETFAIEDILEEQREAIQSLIDLVPNMKFGVGGTVAPADMLFQLYEKSAFSDFDELWERYESDFHVTGNKYLKELKHYIKEYYKSGTFTAGLYLPTETALILFQGVYDIIKSFVGLGSNIDYLNMGRLTFSEFLYCIIITLPMIVSSVGSIPAGRIGSGVAYDLDFGSLKYSESPLHILHLRANYCVWYNNYRDVLLETECMEPQDTDAITYEELFTLLVPRQRCWDKDAFTTALDNPGTGNVGVPFSLSSAGYYGESVRGYDITKINNIGIIDDGDMNPYVIDKDNSNIAEVTIGDDKWRIPTAYLSGKNPLENLPTPSGEDVTVSGFSLYALDAAKRAQKWLQKALFFGNRITDFYYMRFGVKHLDARLHKPELLTSSSELVKLDVVMNNTNITTEAGGEIYQSVAGDRSAYASAYDNGNSYDRFCEEHGVILSYLTIMPQPTYAYGQGRDYSRLDQFDYAFAEFATLGMDAVYDTEICSTSFNRDGAKVFGYQGRYYDYKAKHSEEHGELLDSQDMYTFGRRFDMFSEDGAPKLNYAFVHCFPPLDMFVVDSKLADYFRFDMRHSTAAERLLPAQSIYI